MTNYVNLQIDYVGDQTTILHFVVDKLSSLEKQGWHLQIRLQINSQLNCPNIAHQQVWTLECEEYKEYVKETETETGG